MRRLSVFAGITAALFWGTAAMAGEKIKLPSGPSKATPQVTTAIQHGPAMITKTAWPARALRNGWAPGGYGYTPYYSYYRPYYAAPYYGGYSYTRPYYGYSYYSPGWSYGWGPGVTYGGGPLAYGRLGGWYW